MTEISAIVITKNEERKIADCLNSVAFADEIVLVDHFSEDQTFVIARKLGAKVYQETWTDFSTQKNSALDKATKPWVLSIDADERITPELKEEILRVVDSPNPLDGYFVKRKNFFCNQWVRHGGWHPDRKLRLFKRASGRFEERSVHEKIKLEGPCGYLENYMEHFTYDSVSEYIGRMDIYSKLSSEEIGPRKRWTRYANLTFRPLFTAFKMLVLRRGILDGAVGLFLAFSYSYYTFLKYYRYYERQDRSKSNS